MGKIFLLLLYCLVAQSSLAALNEDDSPVRGKATKFIGVSAVVIKVSGTSKALTVVLPKSDQKWLTGHPSRTKEIAKRLIGLRVFATGIYKDSKHLKCTSFMIGYALLIPRSNGAVLTRPVVGSLSDFAKELESEKH